MDIYMCPGVLFYLDFGEKQSLVRELCGLSTVCSMW